MKPIPSLALAAAAALALSPSVQANPRGGGGGGQHFNFSSSAGPSVRASAPAVRSVAPMQRSFSPQRSFTPVQRSFVQTPSMGFRAPTVANNNVRRFSAAAAPSFAFGGHAVNPTNRNVVNNVAIANTNARFAQQQRLHSAQVYRNNNLANRFAPGNVSRDWDHRRVHNWNNHNYRWFGNSWVIADGYGYGYATYPYYSSYDYPDSDYVTNDAVVSDNDYDANAGESLGAEVQRALADQGYYRGEVDGEVGPMTRNAIATYQRDRHMPVTGSIDSRLINSLGLE